jgi:hypothetical protein
MTPEMVLLLDFRVPLHLESFYPWPKVLVRSSILKINIKRLLISPKVDFFCIYFNRLESIDTVVGSFYFSSILSRVSRAYFPCIIVEAMMSND